MWESRSGNVTDLMKKAIKTDIVVIVEKTNTGYSAYAKDYPACSTGKSFPELKTNILEALNFYFEGEAELVADKDIRYQFEESFLE